jgi:serine phosphatase RsbU (regulator of sigma subunit)
VVIEAAQAMGCDSLALDTREGEVWLVRYGYRLPRGLLGSTFRPSEGSFISEAVRTQQVVTVHNAYDDPRTDEAVQRRYSIPSLMVAPVVVAGETEALLFFNYHAEKARFSEAEIDFAANLAALLGLALRNAALYRGERDLSATLQEALLRVAPRLPGVEYGHLHRSATAGANVGGDFYDLFPMVDWRVGILIGDVAGKGVEASALASLAKNAMKAYLHEEIDPAGVLAKTNALLIDHSPSRTFVTAFLGVLDLRSGRLTYSFAGHPPALLRRSTGEVLPLRVGSLIMGVFEGADYPAARTRLDPEDVLLLYTDGVIEARRQEDFYGEERLLAYLRDTRLSAPELPEHLLDEVMKFADGRLTDDLAVLSLTRVPGWSPASSVSPAP